jgi:hypothetical protein
MATRRHVVVDAVLEDSGSPVRQSSVTLEDRQGNQATYLIFWRYDVTLPRSECLSAIGMWRGDILVMRAGARKDVVHIKGHDDAQRVVRRYASGVLVCKDCILLFGVCSRFVQAAKPWIREAAALGRGLECPTEIFIKCRDR